MDEEEAALAIAQVEAQADVTQAAIAAEAQVASAEVGESGETERAAQLASALQMRDDDRARMAALESQVGELRLAIEQLSAAQLATALVAEEAAIEAEEAAADDELSGIPELETPAGEGEQPPAAAEGEQEPPRGQRGHRTALQRRREKRLG